MKERARTDPRQLEELRRIEGAAAEDHLAGTDRLGPAALALDLDAGRASTVHMDPGHERPRPELQVGPMPDRVEIRASRAHPTTLPDVPIERREALLPVAVHVRRQVISGLDCRVEPRAEQRARRRAALEAEWSAMAAPGVIRGRGGAVLHPLEVGEAMRVRP